MKYSFLTLVITLTSYSIYAQTNTFPSNGNVGIGTVNPIAKFEINSGTGVTPLRAVGPHGYLLIDNVGSGESYYYADKFHQFQGTSGTPILTMLNTGNIGIGTTSPVSKLDISGILHIAYPGILNYSSTGGTYIGWNKSGGGGEANFVNNIAGGSIGGFTFDKTTNGSTFTRLLTISDNGNVGIGTTSPEHKLTVVMDGATNGTGVAIKAVNSGGVGSQPGLTFLNSLGNKRMYNYLDVSSDTYNIGNAQSLPLITINQAGNVGIGTTTPDAELAVNGTIHSKEVKVDMNGFPDYVFKPDYPLLPLTEVKAFINQNHHLPEMPSEKEVIKEGINLGEMNKLLVKKIEELTLYLIQQKEESGKQNKILQQQINELKKHKSNH